MFTETLKVWSLGPLLQTVLSPVSKAKVEMSNKQKEAYLIFGEFLFFSWKYGPVCGCCSMCINQENFFLNINESINSRDSENCSAGLMPTLSVWTQFWEPFHSIFSHERSSFYFPSSLPSLWNHNLNKISSPISIDSAVPLLYSRSQNEMNTVTLHVNVWQNPLQCCEVISLQLIKINEKKKRESCFVSNTFWWNVSD